MRDAATPLVIAALRRMFAMSPEGMQEDPVLLDGGRATSKRIASARSWHAAHPQGARPFMHNLRDASRVLRAVGVRASQVHLLRRVYDLPADAPDETLLLVAHAATSTHASGFTDTMLRRLRLDHGWTLDDVLAWCARFGAISSQHLSRCGEAGWGPGELRTMLRDGVQVPDEGQVEMMLAFRMAPPRV